MGRVDRWRRIRYPGPLRPGDTIGVTAPSDGVARKCHARLEVCLGHLRGLGYRVREGRCLRASARHVSGSREERVRDLMELWHAPEVRAIFPPWGGELLVHLLPRIDFEALAAAGPKWILGYSDTSTLLFALTLRTGIATAHGTTLMEMVPGQLDPAGRWRTVLALRAGQSVTLRPSRRYQVKGPDWADQPGATFRLTHRTRWRAMQSGRALREARFRGRLIGGCLETVAMLAGTPYGDLERFQRLFRREGVVLYLESAEGTPGLVCRLLWHLRLAGWFDGLRGLVLGRPADDGAGKAFTYLDALGDALGGLDLPVIYGADIGHRPPQATLVNGAMADFHCGPDGTRVRMSFR